jgi:hypothetical protein
MTTVDADVQHVEAARQEDADLSLPMAVMMIEERNRSRACRQNRFQRQQESLVLKAISMVASAYPNGCVPAVRPGH